MSRVCIGSFALGDDAHHITLVKATRQLEHDHFFKKIYIYNARSNGPQSEMNKEKREAKQLAREDGTFSGFFFLYNAARNSSISGPGEKKKK